MLVFKNGPLRFFNSISTDVSKIKFKKVPVYIKNGGYILFFSVLYYLRAFSYSPYISLACMRVTVPTESNKYRYYAMPGTLFKKTVFQYAYYKNDY